MKSPFFSIVIPTKNRVEPLKIALKSILEQEFQDWECVVVDNNSDDRLEKVCAEIDDPRVRRVKTGGLHMADNYDAALQAARGQYVLLIQDKQALYGHALLVAHHILVSGNHQVLLWRGDVLDDTDPTNIELHQRQSDRCIYFMRSEDILADFTWRTKVGRKLDHFPEKFIVSTLAVVRRATLDEIRSRTGQKIGLPCNPDFTIGCHLLNALDNYIYFNGSMTFVHSLKVSTGFNFYKNKTDTNSFAVEMGGMEIVYKYVPIKHAFVEAHEYNDYFFMSHLLGGRLARYPLTRLTYYLSTHRRLTKSRERGLDRQPEYEAWRKALSGESVWTRIQIRAYLLQNTSKQLAKTIRKWAGLRSLERILKGRQTAQKPNVKRKIIDADSFLREETRRLRALDEHLLANSIDYKPTSSSKI